MDNVALFHFRHDGTLNETARNGAQSAAFHLNEERQARIGFSFLLPRN